MHEPEKRGAALSRLFNIAIVTIVIGVPADGQQARGQNARDAITELAEEESYTVDGKPIHLRKMPDITVRFVDAFHNENGARQWAAISGTPLEFTKKLSKELMLYESPLRSRTNAAVSEEALSQLLSDDTVKHAFQFTRMSNRE